MCPQTNTFLSCGQMINSFYKFSAEVRWLAKVTELDYCYVPEQRETIVR